MELRLDHTSRPARTLRPMVIRLRQGLTIGRHGKPFDGDLCMEGCQYCTAGQHADVVIDTAKFPSLVSRIHARIEVEPTSGAFTLLNLSINRTKVGEKNLKKNKAMPLDEGVAVKFCSTTPEPGIEKDQGFSPTPPSQK